MRNNNVAEESYGFMAPGATDPVGGTMNSSISSSTTTTTPIPTTPIDEPTTFANAICRTRHPIAAFFHIAFKGTAMVLYMFHSLFGLDYVSSFIFITLLLAADFWTVKNVTGRLLVGLRWWHRVAPTATTTTTMDDEANTSAGGPQKNEWIFESSPSHATVPSLDRRLFWSALYIAPITFAFFFLASFLSLSWDWSLVSAIATGLTAANLVGYMKCSKNAQQRLAATLADGGSAFSGFGGLRFAAAAAAATSSLPALGAVGSNMLNMLTNSNNYSGGGGSSSGNGGGDGYAYNGNRAQNNMNNNNNSGNNNNNNNNNNGNTTSGSSSRAYAARSGPGEGTISDFSAVADPFGNGGGTNSSSSNNNGGGSTRFTGNLSAAASGELVVI